MVLSQTISFDACDCKNAINLLLLHIESNEIISHSDVWSLYDLGILTLQIDSLQAGQYWLTVYSFDGTNLTDNSIRVRCIDPIGYTCGEVISGKLSGYEPYQFRAIYIPTTVSANHVFHSEDNANITFDLYNGTNTDNGQIIMLSVHATILTASSTWTIWILFALKLLV